MAFRIGKPSQESFFALNAIPLYSYAIPLRPSGGHVWPPLSSRTNPAAAQDAGFQTRNVGSQPHFCIIDFHVSVVF
jgi:hypothetical protein